MGNVIWDKLTVDNMKLIVWLPPLNTMNDRYTLWNIRLLCHMWVEICLLDLFEYKVYKDKYEQSLNKFERLAAEQYCVLHKWRHRNDKLTGTCLTVCNLHLKQNFQSKFTAYIFHFHKFITIYHLSLYTFIYHLYVLLRLKLMISHHWYVAKCQAISCTNNNHNPWVTHCGLGMPYWWHRFVSTMAQVMACCLTASSHYLNECWLIIRIIQCHSPKSNIFSSFHEFIRNMYSEIALLKWLSLIPAAKELTHLPLVMQICVSESDQHWFR